MVGRKNSPSENEIEGYGPMCRKLQRLWLTSFSKEDSGSIYLHTIAAHGGDYIRHLKSLGKFMNSGVELRHRVTNRMLLHTNGGGAPGTQSSRGVDGNMTANVHEQSRIDEKKQVLENQNRTLYEQITDAVDLEFIIGRKIAQKVWPSKLDDPLGKEYIDDKTKKLFQKTQNSIEDEAFLPPEARKKQLSGKAFMSLLDDDDLCTEAKHSFVRQERAQATQPSAGISEGKGRPPKKRQKK